MKFQATRITRDRRTATISVVLPVFNETAILQELNRRIVTVLERTTSNFEVVYVNDGSSDGSRENLNALAALDRGDRAEHDRLVVEASRDLRDCDLIALAQYSMAPAVALVAEATGRPVLTTPDSAVLKLKELLGVAG